MFIYMKMLAKVQVQTHTFAALNERVFELSFELTLSD